MTASEATKAEIPTHEEIRWVLSYLERIAIEVCALTVPTAPRVLTLRQIAERVDRTVETVKSWRREGRGPRTFRLEGRVVALESDVDAWVWGQAIRARSVRGGSTLELSGCGS